MLDIRAYNKYEKSEPIRFDESDFSNKELTYLFRDLWMINIGSNTFLSKDSRYYFYVGSNVDTIDEEYLFELKRKPKGEWELPEEAATQIMNYKARGVLYLYVLNEKHEVLNKDERLYKTRIRLEFDGKYGSLYNHINTDLRKSITSSSAVQNQHTFDKYISGAIWPIEYYEKIVSLYPVTLSKTNKYFSRLSQGIEVRSTPFGINPVFTYNIPINRLMLFMFRELIRQHHIVSEALQKDIESATNRLSRTNIDTFEKRHYNKIVQRHNVFLERVSGLKQQLVSRYKRLIDYDVKLPELNEILHFKEITYDRELAEIVKSVYTVLNTLGYNDLNEIEHSVEPFNQLYQRWVYDKVEQALLKIGCKIKKKTGSATFVPIPESTEFTTNEFEIDYIKLNYEKQYAIYEKKGLGVFIDNRTQDKLANKSRPDITIELYSSEIPFPSIITIDATIANTKDKISIKQAYKDNIKYYKNQREVNFAVSAAWVFHPFDQKWKNEDGYDLGDFELNMDTEKLLPELLRNIFQYAVKESNFD